MDTNHSTYALTVTRADHLQDKETTIPFISDKQEQKKDISNGVTLTNSNYDVTKAFR